MEGVSAVAVIVVDVGDRDSVFVSFGEILFVDVSFDLFAAKGAVEMACECVASVFASEAYEHIVPFPIQRGRGSHVRTQ